VGSTDVDQHYSPVFSKIMRLEIKSERLSSLSCKHAQPQTLHARCCKRKFNFKWNSCIEIQRRSMGLCHGVWSLIRRMQQPNRMADFLIKQIYSNRFAHNESANIFKSRIGIRKVLVSACDGRTDRRTDRRYINKVRSNTDACQK